MVPCFAASGDDFVVCFIGPVGEGILSGILPDYVKALERELGVGAHPRLIDACWPLMPEMRRNTQVIWGNFKRMSGL